jgi:hypothetical protein
MFSSAAAEIHSPAAQGPEFCMSIAQHGAELKKLATFCVAHPSADVISPFEFNIIPLPSGRGSSSGLATEMNVFGCRGWKFAHRLAIGALDVRRLAKGVYDRKHCE